jgi:hypothetical protein
MEKLTNLSLLKMKMKKFLKFKKKLQARDAKKISIIKRDFQKPNRSISKKNQTKKKNVKKILLIPKTTIFQAF